MGVNNHGPYFFNNRGGINFPGGKILDGVVEREPIFIETSFNAVIDDVNNLFM